jgi:hypothetical protein
MTAAMDILITRAEQSRLGELSLENIAFGKHFTDHMLEVDYVDGKCGSFALWTSHLRRDQSLQR